MDPTVPRPAAILLDFIRKVETGRADATAYDTIYAHKQNKLPKPITRMTLAELQGHQAKGWPAKSTASGAYQFMRATLADLRQELKLRDGQVFHANLQDRLGYHLLRRRGYDQFIAGKLSLTAFGNNLAKEWASLPVLTDVKGQHRQLKAGQSYYAGDGLNKALVGVQDVRTVLSQALNEVDRHSPAPSGPGTDPGSVPPKPGGIRPAGIIIAIVILVAAAAFFFWRF